VSKATLHAAVTVAFWAAWLAVVYVGAQLVFARWPSSGNVLGVLGTLLLFSPTASLMAWDAMERVGRRPLGPGGQPVRPAQGYVTFSWRGAWINTLGITLIGIGFGVNYLAGP
jgi:hypothetical protein